MGIEPAEITETPDSKPLRVERFVWPATMKIATVARYLDASSSLVRKFMADPVDPLPAYRLGSDYRIDRVDLDAWKARRKAAVQPGTGVDALIAELRAAPR
jgi:excisionase family DNA binding protein